MIEFINLRTGETVSGSVADRVELAKQAEKMCDTFDVTIVRVDGNKIAVGHPKYVLSHLR